MEKGEFHIAAGKMQNILYPPFSINRWGPSKWINSEENSKKTCKKQSYVCTNVCNQLYIITCLQHEVHNLGIEDANLCTVADPR